MDGEISQKVDEDEVDIEFDTRRLKGSCDREEVAKRPPGFITSPTVRRVHGVDNLQQGGRQRRKLYQWSLG